MLSQEPVGVKFEEKSLSEKNPVSMYRRVFFEDTVVRMHYHRSLEINMCDNAEGTLIVEGNRIPLDEYSLIVIKPNVLHSYAIPANSGEITVWHIGLNYFSLLNTEYIENHLEMDQPVILSDTPREQVELLLNRLLTERGLRKGAALLNLLDEVFKPNNLVPGYSKDTFLHKILSFSEENFHTRISLDDAASAVNLSRYYFCRKFKNRTGVTFNEYVNNLRMENSLACLDKGMTVSEAAWKSGFEDVSYFIKRFKSMYGITPGEYAEQ